jgi:hypothetical protein
MPARLGYQERSSPAQERGMASPIDDEDKPLDPAVERVRRRLARFMAINLGILFLAVMAVVAAIVYKLGRIGEPARSDVAGALPPSGEEMASGRIALPAGARMTGQTLSGNRLLITAALADGGSAIFIYDIAERRMIARLDVAAQP